MTISFWKIVALGVLAALAASPACAEPCQLRRAAAVDMAIDGSGRLTVPMTIAGQPVNMMIDTGGVQTMLTESVAASLALAPQSLRGVRVVAFGGDRITRFVSARDIVLGGLKAPKLDFLLLPDSHLTTGVGGILAPDILRAYDVDFDFASGRFNLFAPTTCDGNLVYWTDAPSAVIPFDIDAAGHIRFSVTLDGVAFDAALDTGASVSFLDLDAARRLFKLDETNPALENMGRGRYGVHYRYPFRALTFGSVTVNNPDLDLLARADTHMGPGPRMLLGMGIIRQLHLYIAYKQRRLVVTAASAH